MTQPANRVTAVTLDRDDAEEIAEGVGALGSWLYQAPEAIRRDFARHAFPTPLQPLPTPRSSSTPCTTPGGACARF
jgi:hypothetical protein